MEEQEILNLETGEKEAQKLEPKKVKIVKTSVKSVGEKGNQKADFEVKHPDREETINVSEVKYEKNSGLVVSGTWINFDEDNKIRKGSALANLLAFFDAKNIKEMEGKEVETADDGKGYLCIKAY